MPNLAATQLLSLLKERGLKVDDSATLWLVNHKLTYRPITGEYRVPPSLGGAKGVLRGSPKSIAQQISKLLGKE